ncbi:MAG: UPF0755 protein [Parcubacteria group bacterium Gr01-1014_30]|nr:MAG: UPF0755 protein [Parcubacteria group bacterium Gr01-1014_30]
MKFLTIGVLLLVIFLGFFVWQGIYLPLDVNGQESLFSVEKGQNAFQIAENLEREEMVKNSFFFSFYAVTSGNATKLKTGDYFLSPSLTVANIVKKIASGDTATVTVTIPEGWTVAQIEERLGVELSSDLEGFLFPDTYNFSVNYSEKDVAEAMRENFERKLDSELHREIEKQGKTIHQIVTMASIIEKEVRTSQDKELVAGILWKRLEAGIPLQVDATITYITGKRTTKVSTEDTQIDSPYNTYRYRGLPAGPISNPGLEAILASVYPKSSEYWYYLSTPEGKTIFSITLPEHNEAKALHLK